MKATTQLGHLSIVVQGAIQDRVAAMATKTDVLTDIAWFENHPGITTRDRPASKNEIRGYGLSPGVMALVYLHHDGGVARAFYDPPKKNK